MIYQYLPPAPALAEFVRDYLVAHFVFDQQEPVPFKPYSPKPEQTITFLPRGSLSVMNPLTGATVSTSAVNICGQQVSRQNFHISREYLMFRIHFRPGALYRLLGIPLGEFTDRWFDAGPVISAEIREVNDRLANCTGYEEMIRVAERWLEGRIRQAKAERHAIDRVASCILMNPSVSIDWLAGQACLCERQFYRKFTERMGVSPKLYSRIVRFYKAYQYKESHPSESWLSVALQSGYADHQHMAKDFREFALSSPNLWISEDNQSPERILHLE